MESVRKVAGSYWVAYYLVYLAGVGVGLWKYPPFQEHGNEVIYLLAAIFGAAAGLALLVAILLEVTGRMVLLIPAAIKKYREEGRKVGREEGREEGREQGREQERQRIIEELGNLSERNGGGVQVTPDEVIKILRGASASDS